MIIIPSRDVIVVATPRTGSRALKDAILNSSEPGVKATKEHHPFPHEVWNAQSRGRRNEPWEVWTMIREPLSQLKSWMSHASGWGDPTKFIASYRIRYFFYEGGMNIYRNVVTRYFVYEDNGHQKLLDELNLKDTPKLTVVGKTNSQEHQLTPHQEELARRRFKQDFVLYQQVTEGY